MMAASVAGILLSDASWAQRLIFLLLGVAMAGFMLWILYGTFYRLTATHLLVRSGPFRYAIPLAEINFFGWPLSFYMAAQGSLIIYVVIIWYYARAMRKMDLEYGVDEGDTQ